MAARSASRRKLEAWAQKIHYIRAAGDSRRRARKRVVRAADLKWEENLQGKNAYIIDSITGVNSKNSPCSFVKFLRAPQAASTITISRRLDMCLKGEGTMCTTARRWVGRRAMASTSLP